MMDEPERLCRRVAIMSRGVVRAIGSPYELARLIAEGLDNAQIAARLAISEKTVRNHITRVFAKLDVTTRAQAIVLAHSEGLAARGRA